MGRIGRYYETPSVRGVPLWLSHCRRLSFGFLVGFVVALLLVVVVFKTMRTMVGFMCLVMEIDVGYLVPGVPHCPASLKCVFSGLRLYHRLGSCSSELGKRLFSGIHLYLIPCFKYSNLIN